MKPGMQWPIGIAVVLTGTVIANLAMMRVANSDPSFAVEPDYYQKAVTFDSTLAHANASAKLGWTAHATIAKEQSASPYVTVTLRDSLQLPIDHATVTVHALFNARANDVLSVTLEETSPGSYRALLPVQHAGIWEVRIAAIRGAQQFESSVRVEVAPSAVSNIITTDSLSGIRR